MKYWRLPLAWFSFSVLMGSCQCGKTPEPTTYHPYIFYHNNSGQDLLDPATVGGYKLDSIKLDGNSATLAEMMIVNTSHFNDTNLPKGYGLTFMLIPSKEKAVITIGKKISDTLYYSFSGTALTQCRYNKIPVQPPGSSNTFPLVFPVSVMR